MAYYRNYRASGYNVNLDKLVAEREMYKSGSISIWAEAMSYNGYQTKIMLSRYDGESKIKLGRMTLDETIAVGAAMAAFATELKTGKVAEPTVEAEAAVEETVTRGYEAEEEAEEAEATPVAEPTVETVKETVEDAAPATKSGRSEFVIMGEIRNAYMDLEDDADDTEAKATLARCFEDLGREVSESEAYGEEEAA